jgi:NADPH-dependent F420 reductase
MKNLDAAKVADVIVLAIPYVAQGDILPEIREAVEGKVVVDTTVPLRSVVPPELERIPEGSSAQRVQSLLPGSKVVCGLHTVSAARLRRLGEPLEGDVLLCGDDDVAKGIVMELVRDLGMRALDAGGLARAASLEHLALLVLTLNHKYGTREIGVRFVGV